MMCVRLSSCVDIYLYTNENRSRSSRLYKLADGFSSFLIISILPALDWFFLFFDGSTGVPLDGGKRERFILASVERGSTCSRRSL